MDLRIPLPLPATSDQGSGIEKRRMWIGNLDKRVTELQLVKLLQNYGPIENFDLLYHKTGPEAGLPRGYAFVTYENEDSALKLREALDGKKLGLKRLSIQWAHNVDKDTLNQHRRDISIPALGVGTKEEPKDASVSSKIKAIESKLKMMSQLPEEEFQIATKPSSSAAPSTMSSSKKTIPTYKSSAKFSKTHSSNPRFRPYTRP
uniref:Probable RNA-binding protein 18 n=1 Tax=Lygus hesperus TaxID=30085 RepID=A0A0A9XRZ0_LYGHE